MVHFVGTPVRKNLDVAYNSIGESIRVEIESNRSNDTRTLKQKLTATMFSPLLLTYKRQKAEISKI